MMKILKRKNKKGFTLMEMLIVIGIIAILVAIAIPTFSGANKKAKYAADLANVRSWYAEVLVDYMDNGTALPAKDTVVTGKIKTQMTGASVKVTNVDPFTVEYKSGDASKDKDDKPKYPDVTFPADTE